MVVINRKVRSALMPAVAIASLMVLDGCKEDEVTPKFSDDLLIGDWQVTEIDSESYDDYMLTFKFEANKDFDICVDFMYNNLNISYCYSDYSGGMGSWKWQDASNTTLLITSDEEDITADVVSMDNTNMELRVTQEDYDGDLYTENYKFVKVQ